MNRPLRFHQIIEIARPLLIQQKLIVDELIVLNVPYYTNKQFTIIVN